MSYLFYFCMHNLFTTLFEMQRRLIELCILCVEARVSFALSRNGTKFSSATFGASIGTEKRIDCDLFMTIFFQVFFTMKLRSILFMKFIAMQLTAINSVQFVMQIGAREMSRVLNFTPEEKTFTRFLSKFH